MGSAPKDDKQAERIGFDQVFRDELAQVQARWQAVYEPAAASNDDSDDDSSDSAAGDDGRELAERTVPTVDHGLVGLGLSGGGIRSATFNLGIVQSLVRRGVFRHVDYISTVSGGGYLGSAISAGMARPGARFPYPYVWGSKEAPGVTWLRNHSNYMVSTGFIDWLRIAAVLVRGILLNVLVIVPGLMVLAMLVAWLYGDQLRAWDATGVELGQCFRLTSWVGAAAVLYFLAYAPIISLVQLRYAGLASKENRLISSMRARNDHELSHAWVLLGLGLAVLVDSLPLLEHGFHRLGQASDAHRDLLTGLGSAGSLVAGLLTRVAWTKAGSLLKRAGMLVLGLAGLFLPLVVILIFAENLVYGQGLLHDTADALGLSATWLALACPVVLWLFCQLFVDVNLTSMHGLYRDRLACAYRVGQPAGCGPDDELERVTHDLPLSRLCQPGSRAPYHLVNTALNLQGSKDPCIRERRASHFVLSKEYVGGEHCGYARTGDLEEVHPQADLAVGMAISAAAASPNMGSYTMSSLTMLMVLLNVRLGYWLPNPAALTPWAARASRPWLRSEPSWLARAWRRLRWKLPASHLLAEMLGRVHDEGRFVNLSDGGHIENLGAIELLRRRARFIIIGDGAADPQHSFGGLANLMRQARLDLGIEMRMVLDDLRMGADGVCLAHCAVGRVVYPARTPGEKPEDGWIVYFKLSITRDEDELIREYQANNPSFPHQSTADQFFDEGQFEAYRALGFHAAEQLFPPLHADAGQQDMSYAELAKWFMAQISAAAERVGDDGVKVGESVGLQPDGPLPFMDAGFDVPQALLDDTE